MVLRGKNTCRSFQDQSQFAVEILEVSSMQFLQYNIPPNHYHGHFCTNLGQSLEFFKCGSDSLFATDEIFRIGFMVNFWMADRFCCKLQHYQGLGLEQRSEKENERYTYSSKTLKTYFFLLLI